MTQAENLQFAKNCAAHTDGESTLCFVDQATWNTLWNSLPPGKRNLDKESRAGKIGFQLLGVGDLLFCPILFTDNPEKMERNCAQLRAVGYWSKYTEPQETTPLVQAILQMFGELWFGNTHPKIMRCGKLAYEAIANDTNPPVPSIMTMEIDYTIPATVVSLICPDEPGNPKHNRILDVAHLIPGYYRKPDWQVEIGKGLAA